MRISWNWLNEYLNTDLSIEQTCEILTSIGLEVEQIESVSSIRGGLKGLVIGQVLTCVQHPNADKLKLTTVDLGHQLGIQHIVCGAPNVAVGQRVVVAPVGTTVYPISGEPFEIKSVKIRGEQSNGMICAEDEIGIGQSHSGIIVLPDDVPIGSLASDYYQILSDTAIEIGLTPNRTDAMSHMGVARDLYTACVARGIDCKYNPNGRKFDSVLNQNPTESISVEVISDKCTQYYCVKLNGVMPSESPDWLKFRLQVIGERSINPVVDCSNYLLHDIGQPTHCFDADAIASHHLIVTEVNENTTFQTLLDSEIQLNRGDLVISDAHTIHCLAGIIGGKDSSVSHATRSIILECAYFLPKPIRITSTRVGIRSESSLKYEKGIDPNNVQASFDRMIAILANVTGFTPVSNMVKIKTKDYPKYDVTLDIDKLYQYSGYQINNHLIEKILNSMQIDIVSKDGQLWQTNVPQYRFDVRRTEDLIEEIMRIVGYDSVPYPEFLRSTLSFTTNKSMIELEESMANLLMGNSYVEIMTNSIASNKFYDHSSVVPLLNSMTSELNCMRSDMIFGFLEVAGYNINRDQKDLKLFEIGNVYSQEADKYFQRKKLALLHTGYISSPFWSQPQGVKSSFYSIKSDVYTLIERYAKVQKVTEIEDNSQIAYGINIWCQNQMLASLGALDPKVLKSFDIKQDVFMAEIDIQALYEISSKSKIVYREVPKFPSIKRDLALILPVNVNFGQIEQIAKKLHNDLLSECFLFDVYIDQSLNGKKSYATRFVFQHHSQTFTDTQIEQMMSQLIDTLSKELGATLR